MKSRVQAFSLIELMVALAIAAILTLMIGQMMSSVLKSWTKEKGNLRKNMDARAVIELLVSDLQALVIRPDPLRVDMEWFHKINDTTAKAEADANGGYLSAKPSWLMFLAVPVDRNTSVAGNVCAVSYRVGYQDPLMTGAAGNYRQTGLFRCRREADETFKNVLNLTNLHTNYWALPTANPRVASDFLIANVIDFQVAFEALNPDDSVVTIPPSATVRLGDKLQVDPSPGNLQDGAKLQSVDLVLTLINEDAVKKLETVSGTPRNRIISESSQRYVRRVRLNY